MVASPQASCTECSGIKANIANHDGKLKGHDHSIESLSTRVDKPGWVVTMVISLLTFIVGVETTIIAAQMKWLAPRQSIATIAEDK